MTWSVSGELTITDPALFNELFHTSVPVRPKVGLIARANDRGLGIQTWEAYRHYPFARTLVVMVPSTKFPDYPHRYSHDMQHGGRDWDVKQVVLDLDNHQLPEEAMREWVAGLDVVFSVETLYDWRVADWVREAGGRTVVQANPELFVHRRKIHEIEPDVWAWPTPWRPFDDLPEGVSLPVPIPDGRPRVAADPDEGRMTVLHVAGHRALDDRNGTDGFFDAIKRIRSKVTVRVVGQDGQLPKLHRVPRNIEVELVPDGVRDRWDMYSGVHAVVLPRRYGGLCLPALEAAASGCAIAMPNISPNPMWPIIPLDARRARNTLTQAGLLTTHNTVVDSMAYTCNVLADHRDRLRRHQDAAFAWAQENTWAQLSPVYDDVFRGALL